jgi:hypothetical protein
MAIVQISAYDEFVEFITSLPTLEQISEYRLSDETEAQISALMERNNEGALSADEETELDEYLRLEHIMRKAKIRAFEKLDQRA